MKQRLLFITLLLILLTTLLSSKEEIDFRTISILDGLSNPHVYAIIQDSRGLIWIGTKEGLNRFDGYEFTIFKHDPENSNSLSDNWVTSLLEDRQGQIWIGTENGGLNRLNPHTREFTHYRESEGLSDDSVWGLLQADDGTIWIATYQGGLSLLETDETNFEYINTKTAPPLSHNNVWPLLKDRQGQIWIGTDGGGLNLYNQKRDEILYYMQDPRDPHTLNDNRIWSLYEDSKGTLWIGTQGGGLNRMSAERDFYHYLHDPSDPETISDNTIQSIFEDKQGRFWIGSDQGLNLFDQNQGTFRHLFARQEDPSSLINNKVRAIMQDHSNVVWIGTDQGISQYIPEKFTSASLPGLTGKSDANPMVRSLLKTKGGSLLIGTDRGLILQTPDKTTMGPYLKGSSIYALLQDRDDKIWIGTNRGLYFSQDNLQTIQSHDVNILKSTRIEVLYQDREGDLWAGTFDNSKGLCRITKRGEVSWYTRSSGLPQNDITALWEDKEGELWVGTEGGGIAIINKERHQIRLLENVKASFINTITQTGKTIWIGSYNSGLIRYNKSNGSTRYYTEKDGLPNNVVRGVIPDKERNLWISTNKGFARFMRESETFIPYSLEDGLPSLIFTKHGYHSAHDGEFFFGTVDGFMRFYPEEIRRERYHVPVIVTSYKIAGKEQPLSALSRGKNVKIPWHNKSITFTVAGLDYKNPGQIRYAYRLNDDRSQWVDLGQTREISFLNLSPGRYTLSVKATNSDGLWNQTSLSLPFTITPPPWSRWYALLLYGVIIAGVIILIIRHQTAAHTKKIREQEHLVNQRTQELREANNQKTTFFINLAHETKTPLTLIDNYLNRYIRKHGTNEDLQIIHTQIEGLLRDMVNYLDAEKIQHQKIVYDHDTIISLSRLSRQITELFTAPAQQKRITIKEDIQPDISIQADPSAIERILVNLLDNALKYCPQDSEITVTLNKRGSKIILTIADNGPGMEKDKIKHLFEPYYQLSHQKSSSQGIGMGLYIVHTIISSLPEGTIHVNSGPGEGTRFTMTFLEAPADSSLPVDDHYTPALSLHTYQRQELTESALSPGKPVILVVEDNRDLLKMIQEELKEEYNLFLATDGEMALDKLKSMPAPQVIISDIMMERMDGRIFFQKINQDSSKRHIPFIFITAHSDKNLKVQSLREGACDYIHKPFQMEELKAKIKALIQQNHHLRAQQNTVITEKIRDFFKEIPLENSDEGEVLQKIFHNHSLTQRESDTLTLMIQEKNNKEISSQLGISIRTVEFHIHNIYQKFEVQNKIELLNRIQELRR